MQTKSMPEDRVSSLWVQWRLSGYNLPVLVAVVLLGTFLLMLMALRMESDNTGEVMASLVACALATPIVLAFLTGKPLLDRQLNGVSTFPAEEVVAARMKVAALSTALSWVLVVALLALMFPFWINTDVWTVLQMVWWQFHAYPLPFKFAMGTASLVACMFLTWRFLVGGLITTSGRTRTLALTAARVVLVPAFMIGIVAFIDELSRSWGYDDLDRVLSALIWTASLGAIAKLWVSAFSWRKVDRNHARQYLLFWSIGTTCLVALAIVLTPLVWSLVLPSNGDQVRVLLVLIAVMGVPFARLGPAMSSLQKVSTSINGLLAGFAGILTVLIVVLAVRSQTQSVFPGDQIVRHMDQFAQHYAFTGQFMGSVLVARGDEILFSRSYGLANLDRKLDNTPSTKFRIGSVTKQFTAAAILILEEQGELRLEDSITKHLPDAPTAWEKVTLFHLLTHTSGIPRGVGVPNEPVAVPLHTMADHLAVVRDQPLIFPPGERYLYSNSGYVLLGAVIERISGQPYESFLREHVFLPLGMNSSGYDRNSIGVDGHATGYSPALSGPVNAEFVHLSRVHAAGGIHSTVEDLLNWERGLFGGKVLSAESLRKMITPFKEQYGLGLLIETTSIRSQGIVGNNQNPVRRKEISHSGGIQGFNAALSYYPESEVTVAVLSNLNGIGPSSITRELASLAHR